MTITQRTKVEELYDIVKPIFEDCVYLGKTQIGPLEVWAKGDTVLVSYGDIIVLDAYRDTVAPVIAPIMAPTFRDGVWVQKVHEKANKKRAEHFEKHYTPIDDEGYWT